MEERMGGYFGTFVSPQVRMIWMKPVATTFGNSIVARHHISTLGEGRHVVSIGFRSLGTMLFMTRAKVSPIIANLCRLVT